MQAFLLLAAWVVVCRAEEGCCAGVGLETVTAAAPAAEPDADQACDPLLCPGGMLSHTQL